MTDALDLNLLRVFDALVETGSVTGASELLNLSVPATSRALGRLRRAMNDPVLVRSGRGMTPTTFASQAAPRVRSILEDAEAIVSSGRDLEPAMIKRTFAIRINDGVAATLATAAVTAVAAVAPAVTLRFVAEGNESVGPLRDSTLDLDIGAVGTTPPDLHTTVLYRERLVGIVRADTILGRRRRPTLAHLCEQPHVSASRRGQPYGALDEALAEAGLRRTVAAMVPSLAVAMLVVASSSLVGLVPKRLADSYGSALGIRSFAIPAPLPVIDIVMQWHNRLDADPVHSWLRSIIQTALPTA